MFTRRATTLALGAPVAAETVSGNSRVQSTILGNRYSYKQGTSPRDAGVTRPRGHRMPGEVSRRRLAPFAEKLRG